MKKKVCFWRNSVYTLAYWEWRAAAPGLKPLRLPRARNTLAGSKRWFLCPGMALKLIQKFYRVAKYYFVLLTQRWGRLGPETEHVWSFIDRNKTRQIEHTARQTERHVIIYYWVDWLTDWLALWLIDRQTVKLRWSLFTWRWTKRSLCRHFAWGQSYLLYCLCGSNQRLSRICVFLLTLNQPPYD